MACAEYVDGLISPLRVEMENGKTVFLDVRPEESKLSSRFGRLA